MNLDFLSNVKNIKLKRQVNVAGKISKSDNIGFASVANPILALLPLLMFHKHFKPCTANLFNAGAG